MPEKRCTVKTLSQQVRWQLLWLGAAFFLAFLVLLMVFTWYSMEQTTNSLMKLEADSLFREISQNPAQKLPQNDTYSVYRKWEKLPKQIRQQFSPTPIRPEKIYTASIITPAGEVEYLYLSRYMHQQYGELYLLSRHNDAEIEAISLAFFTTILKQAFWISLVVFIVLFILVSWLLRRMSEPMALLSHWAEQLKNDPEKINNIDFPIEELNQLAQQLRSGVDRLESFNRREQQFLKHASHELRTPLAIIQASLDTLNIQVENPSQVTVQRALKASAYMNLLSSTLLWLARESQQPMPKSYIDIPELCEETINEYQYLLNNREIEIQSDYQIKQLEIEVELFNIVLSNLIRNAFQYSGNGKIMIKILRSEVSIINPLTESLDPSVKPGIAGFGLGIQLVQRICQKLNWQFSYQRQANNFCVSFSWK